MIYPLKTARKDRQSNWIHHEIDGRPDQIYKDIRAGLSWPKENAPAYFCIIAQRHRQNEYKRFPLVFIEEKQADALDKLLAMLIDACQMTCCKEIWTDLTDDKRYFKDIYHDYVNDNTVRHIFLCDAPWPDDFNYSMGLVRMWLEKKSFELDKGSLLARQMAMVPVDIKSFSADPEQDFFAVNALRYVIASFQRHTAGPDTMKDIDYGGPENYAGYYPGIPI